MGVVSDEGPQPRKRASEEELAEFASWGAEFIDFLHSVPTADEDQQ